MKESVCNGLEEGRRGAKGGGGIEGEGGIQGGLILPHPELEKHCPSTPPEAHQVSG